jgi:metallophosphoesterase (TIGR03767 family)
VTRHRRDDPAADPLTTASRTILPADVIRPGTERAYRRLGFAGGEAHVLRRDLAASPPAGGVRRSIVHLAHLSDMQIADVQSPARMEFLEALPQREALAPFLPAHRPYEALAAHAVDAVVRTLRALPPSPVTGSPVALAVTTGDAVDNLQWNELQWFLNLMDGGNVAAGTGGPEFEGFQAAGWDGSAFWQPDGTTGRYAERWGFPAYPGLLRDAARAFAAGGLGIPWLACFGNHEALVQGMGLPTAAAARLATGDRKPTAPPPDFDIGAEASVRAFVRDPASLLAGPARQVVPDPARRLFSRREFVQAHLRSGGAPSGHGLSADNLEQGTVYYAHDAVPGVRILVLDTSNPGGNADGSLGARQAAWLEKRLTEVHSSHLDPTGAPTRSGNEDRLVIVASHHGLDSLGNDTVIDGEVDPDPDTDDLPRLRGPEIRSLLHRFPNVVAWLNGHTHEHRIVPRPDPASRTPGFWEITTGSIMDWPVQGRLIELVDNGGGSVSLICTLIDHAAPPDPSSAAPSWRLASIHREVAANDPFLGDESGPRGSTGDRNAELLWQALR